MQRIFMGDKLSDYLNERDKYAKEAFKKIFNDFLVSSSFLRTKLTMIDGSDLSLQEKDLFSIKTIDAFLKSQKTKDFEKFKDASPSIFKNVKRELFNIYNASEMQNLLKQILINEIQRKELTKAVYEDIQKAPYFQDLGSYEQIDQLKKTKEVLIKMTSDKYSFPLSGKCLNEILNDVISKSEVLELEGKKNSYYDYLRTERGIQIISKSERAKISFENRIHYLQNLVKEKATENDTRSTKSNESEKSHLDNLDSKPHKPMLNINNRKKRVQFNPSLKNNNLKKGQLPFDKSRVVLVTR